MDCFAPPLLKVLKGDEAIYQCPRAASRVGRSFHFTGSVGCCCCQVLFEPGLLLCCQVQQRVQVKRNEVDQPQVNAVPLARTFIVSDPTSKKLKINKKKRKDTASPILKSHQHQRNTFAQTHRCALARNFKKTGQTRIASQGNYGAGMAGGHFNPSFSKRGEASSIRLRKKNAR